MAPDTLLRDREEVGSEGGGRDEKEIVRLLIGSRMLRRRRIRNLLLAHLLREGREREDEDEDEGGSEEHRLARLLDRGRHRSAAVACAAFCSRACSRSGASGRTMRTRMRTGGRRRAATITGWSVC